MGSRPDLLGRDARGRASPFATVPSVQRALAVLELVGRSRERLTLSVTGQHLGVPLSTLHGLASTLVHLGYLEREEPAKTYRLGPKVGELAAAYHARIDLVAVAQGAMDRLREQSGETVSLTVLEGNQIVFIDKRPGQGRVQVVNPIGTRLLAHATGAGKAMLAYLPEVELDNLYPEEELPWLTSYTIATRRKLKQALVRIRERGYAFDNQESERGLWAVAACIRDARGYPVGAINIVAPLFRVRSQDSTDRRVLVVEAAAEISEALGWPRSSLGGQPSASPTRGS